MDAPLPQIGRECSNPASSIIIICGHVHWFLLASLRKLRRHTWVQDAKYADQQVTKSLAATEQLYTDHNHCISAKLAMPFSVCPCLASTNYICQNAPTQAGGIIGNQRSGICAIKRASANHLDMKHYGCCHEMQAI